MKVTLFGAAETVTGSCYMVEACGKRFTVDCGMHQGNKAIEKRNWNTEIYAAKGIDFVLLTHAHIDHSGLLPRITKDGFSGQVYCTEPTRDLLELMLIDSAHIQEMEAEWENKKRARSGIKELAIPLYTQEDALATHKLLSTVEYARSFAPAPGLKVTYRDAGHILGSAFIELEVTEEGKTSRVVFSGDFGKKNSLIVKDPDIPKIRPDYLFMESTYGNRDHKGEDTSREELAEAIAYSYKRGEKVIIPAFAVERTQEILYTLHMLLKAGKLPQDMPVYVDSPLAIRATEVFRKHTRFFDAETQEILASGEDPLSLPNLTYTQEVKESQAINQANGPAIVISASGMCNAGRIRHHLRHNLWRPGASVVFVGYQGVGTPGRRIVDGAKSLTLFGEDVSIAARIFTIGGFSAHAGQSQMLSWIGAFAHPNMTVLLTHGEEKSILLFEKLIQERFQLMVRIPKYLENMELSAGTVPIMQTADKAHAEPKVNWDFLLEDMETRLTQLRGRLDSMRERPWMEQVEAKEQIVALNSKLLSILSHL